MTMNDLYASQEKDIEKNINNSRDVNVDLYTGNQSSDSSGYSYYNPYTCTVPIGVPNSGRNRFMDLDAPIEESDFCQGLLPDGDNRGYEVIDPLATNNVVPEIGKPDLYTTIPETGIDWTDNIQLVEKGTITYDKDTEEYTVNLSKDKNGNYMLPDNTLIDSRDLVKDEFGKYILPEGITMSQVSTYFETYEDIEYDSTDNKIYSPARGPQEELLDSSKITYDENSKTYNIDLPKDEKGNYMLPDDTLIDSRDLEKDKFGRYILPEGITMDMVDTRFETYDEISEKPEVTLYSPDLSDPTNIESAKNTDKITNLDKCDTYNIPGTKDKKVGLDSTLLCKEVNLPDPPKSGFGAITTDFSRDMKREGQNFVDGIVTSYKGVGTAALNTSTAFFNAVGGVAAAGMDFVSGIASMPGQLAQSMLNDAASALNDQGQNVRNLTCGIKNKIVKDISNTEFIKKAKDIYNTAMDWASNWDEKLLNSEFFTGSCLCRLPSSRVSKSNPKVDCCSNNNIYTDEYHKTAYTGLRNRCEEYLVGVPYHESYNSANNNNKTGEKNTVEKPRHEYVHSINCNQNLPSYYGDDVSCDNLRFGTNINSAGIMPSRFANRVLDNDISTLNDTIIFKGLDDKKRFRGYDSVSDLYIESGEYNNKQQYSVGTNFYWDVILERPPDSPLPRFPFMGWFPIQSYQLQGLEINTNRVSTAMGDFEFLDSLSLPTSITLTMYETHRMDMDRWLNRYIETVYRYDGENIRILPYKKQCIYIKFYWYDSNWIPIKSEKFICIPKPRFSYEGSSEKDPKLLNFEFSIVGKLYDNDDSSISIGNNDYKPHVSAFKVAVKKEITDVESVKILNDYTMTDYENDLNMEQNAQSMQATCGHDRCPD